jgi:hypothetical protein
MSENRHILYICAPVIKATCSNEVRRSRAQHRVRDVQQRAEVLRFAFMVVVGLHQRDNGSKTTVYGGAVLAPSGIEDLVPGSAERIGRVFSGKVTRPTG